MDLDGTIPLGIRNARQHESIGDLIIVKERLLGLIDLALLDDTGARRAGTGTARVRKVDTRLFGSVDDEDVAGAFDGGVEVVFLGD